MIIKNAVIAGKNMIRKGDVLIGKGGIIEDIVTEQERETRGIRSDDMEVIDCEGSKYVIPGFIDVHTHGFSGYTTEEDEKGLRELAVKYAIRGTLGFCPTIGPRPIDKYEDIIKHYKNAFSGSYDGARFLGLHLEGPYLSPKKAGAIDPESMYSIDTAALERFLIRTEGYIKIMSIAPELEHSKEAVKLLRSYNIIPSAGHTCADFSETQMCIDNGLSHATHTFNAMRSMKNRDPGVLEAVLLNDDVYCELIADGVHVDKVSARLLMKIKGFDRIIAVSDGGKSCGIDYEDGYVFEDGCIVRNGAVYETNQITLTGSTRDLFAQFKLLDAGYNMSLVNKVKLTSANAAENLGINFGSISCGKEANLLIMDKNFNIESIIINGKKFEQ